MSEPATEQDSSYAGLSGKQRLFVDHYIGAANGNATEAARLAGYNGRSGQAGYECLKKPEVRAAIDERLEALSLSSREVLARLTEQAKAAHVDFIKDDGTVDLAGLRKAGLMRLVKKISWDKAGNRVVEFHCAQAALLNLGKHYRLFVDRQEISGPASGPIAVREVTVHLPAEPEADEAATGDDG
jgi:hypothetical protein